MIASIHGKYVASGVSSWPHCADAYRWRVDSSEKSLAGYSNSCSTAVTVLLGFGSPRNWWETVDLWLARSKKGYDTEACMHIGPH